VLFIGSTRSYSIEKWVRKKKPIVPFNNTSSGTCRSERNKSRVGGGSTRWCGVPLGFQEPQRHHQRKKKWNIFIYAQYTCLKTKEALPKKKEALAEVFSEVFAQGKVTPPSSRL
jgi:hypothetical protein